MSHIRFHPQVLPSRIYFKKMIIALGIRAKIVGSVPQTKVRMKRAQRGFDGWRKHMCAGLDIRIGSPICPLLRAVNVERGCEKHIVHDRDPDVETAKYGFLKNRWSTNEPIQVGTSFFVNHSSKQNARIAHGGQRFMDAWPERRRGKVGNSSRRIRYQRFGNPEPAERGAMELKWLSFRRIFIGKRINDSVAKAE
jgi:hypothetical protein